MTQEEDVRYMARAKECAGSSTCSQLQVGCVLVNVAAVPPNFRYLLTRTIEACNEQLPGAQSCEEAGHDVAGGKHHRVVHAELAAVAGAAKRGMGLTGATCYTTHRPCWRCFQALALAGIKRIVYGEEYGVADEVFDHASLLGISMERLKP